MQIANVPSLIAQWPTRQEFADAVGVPIQRVHKWAQNSAIPAWHQAAVLRACERRGLEISPRDLIEMHEAKPTPSADGASA